MKRFLSRVLIVLIACASAATAVPRVEGASGDSAWAATSELPRTLDEPLARDKMGVTIHRMKNGLTVYLSPNDQEPRITAWIGVRAGSAQDPDDLTGMAHYQEHMLFKGSRRLSTLDHKKEAVHLANILELYEVLFNTKDPKKRKEIYAKIDEENQKASKYAVPNEMTKTYKTLGVRGVNAFTSNERTVYICDLPKNRLEAWARLEGDRFLKPVFRLFQTEIEIVYEEKNRSLDNPGSILNEALRGALYRGHPYGRTVLGSIEHLKNPSLARMYSFYNTNYVPNNMAIALSGDFDREEALAVIRKYFGVWNPKRLPERPKKAVTPIRKQKRVEVKYEAEKQIFIAWPTVPKTHPDADALRVMDMVFDNSESGIANLRLNQAQKVKGSGSYPNLHNEAGAWYVWALPKKGQTLEQAEALLMEAVAAVKNGEFSEDDLKANILNFEIGEKYKLESNSGRTWSMIDAFINREDWEHKVDHLKRLRAVTKADVVRAANKYLGEGRVVAMRRKGKPKIPSIEKPDFTKVEIEPGRQSGFFREIVGMPAEPIEPKWVKKGRDYVVKKIRSGRLYAVKNPMNDLFAISFHFKRGKWHERTLCAALGLLDKSGAGDISADDFKRKLYSLGVKFNTGCGERNSSVSLSGIEENMEEALRLMHLRFNQPNIDPDTLEKMIEIWIGQHKDNKVNPGTIHSALSEYAQRGGESSFLRDLTDEELKALKQDELVALLGGFFDFTRRVSYVGTRAPKDVAALILRPDREYESPPLSKPRLYLKPMRTKVVFVHRDMIQSKVGIFAADEVFNPRHFVDYRFYTNYMGGGMSSVIFQEIREARSLAYSAWAGYVRGGRKYDENLIIGVVGTQADKTIEATGLLHKLMRKLPPSKDRFEESRKSIVQGYRTNPLKFRDIPGAVLGWEDYGIRRDPRPWRMKKAKRYTLEELVHFADRFTQKNMTIYILGNRERVDMAALKRMGEFKEVGIDDLFPY